MISNKFGDKIAYGEVCIMCHSDCGEDSPVFSGYDYELVVCGQCPPTTKKDHRALMLQQNILEQQGSRCAVCHGTQPGKKGWIIDHDHVTRKVRGVLCGSCNMGLGLLKDNPDACNRAAAYIRKGG